MNIRNLYVVAILSFSARANALLPIPSDGSDGAFNPTSNVTIDLSQAVHGDGVTVKWDTPQTGGNLNQNRGIYDPLKWAIVFKYSSVNIPVGVTVKFTNHPTHAPVVWLISGNATISGSVDVSGRLGAADAISALSPTEPGPGGFRGGPKGPLGLGGSYGPGGADNYSSATYFRTYGNPQIIPLIGGSGTQASQTGLAAAPSGGGAILIAVAGDLSIGGGLATVKHINANGALLNVGTSFENRYSSGGAIRIIASHVLGDGFIQAIGGDTPTGDGRIRIETLGMSTSLRTAPETIAVAPAEPTPVIFQADTAPTARILSVNSVTPLADPTAPLSATADIPIQNNDAVTVLIQTRNFPVNGIVKLRRTPKYGGYAVSTAAFVSGTFSQATWQVSAAFAQGYTTLQAIATVP